MLNFASFQTLWFQNLSKALRASEADVVASLLEQVQWDSSIQQVIKQQALALSQYVREQAPKKGYVETLMDTYDLSTPEGIALMRLAEALLRIPDAATADAFIADKLSQGDWLSKLKPGRKLFVNITTAGLMLAQKMTQCSFGVISKTTTPLIRATTRQSMKLMGEQFVMAETMDDALVRAHQNPQYRYSFDMLGEAACTEKDAEFYFNAYTQAIHAIGKDAQKTEASPEKSNGISIKLSALYAHFDVAHWETGFSILYERLKKLVLLAKSYNIGMTMDAEEVDRLEYQLALFEKLMQEEGLAGWNGLGIVVQAYQKRAIEVIHLLASWTKQYRRHIMVRLVKGAYWDSEIKRAQVLGLDYYPVFTRKISTDVSYLACAQLLRKHTDTIYVQCATHNAYTLSAVLHVFKGVPGFEVQRLHGMGKDVHDKAMQISGAASRVYAPVGGYKHLLMYLVRRLLENGANTSFVNQIGNEKYSLELLVGSPVDALRRETHKPHPKIPLPCHILGQDRLNSRGEDISDMTTLHNIQADMNQYVQSMPWHAEPLLALTASATLKKPCYNPAIRTELIGHAVEASAEQVSHALDIAVQAHMPWAKQPVKVRADMLRRSAELLEKNRFKLYAILIKEAGKTLSNAIGEVREAIDFCNYYAVQAEKLMTDPVVFPGPTGEHNQMTYRGRGPIVCISPWNFPLAIFAGQIMAALVTGNTVLAKPAEQTPIIAYEAVKLFHEAGIPKEVLQLLPGDGPSVGAALVNDARVAGVMFTGSTETARRINQTLAAKNGPIVPLIAETGGQNVQVVDSSALLEQVVADALESAFDSAGQRCSALRVLFIQEDVAEDFITMLKGAMDLLTVGDPSVIDMDVGPVIDADALAMLEAHVARMKNTAKWVHQGQPASLNGFYIAPTACEISSLKELPGEVFGPVLHIIRFALSDLDKVIEEVNATGYGLTFGMESRIESRFNAVTDAIEAGNAYVNRNMIGAVVGVQPFGGQGLSGTGPKAGGPNYLLRLVHERVLTINTAAMGGNTSLLSL